jgi:preprotein translocase subunit SecE
MANLINNKIVNFIKEAKIELKKVVWPKKNEIKKFTLIIIGVSLATAIFLGFLDYLFSLGIRSIVQ